jgi:hypothetical protein
MMTGIEMLHVPYRGGDAPALADLIGGQLGFREGRMGQSSDINNLAA